MANFQLAIEKLFGPKQEGTKLYEDKTSGEISKFGISLQWLKSIQPCTTAERIRDLRAEEASALYEYHWWEHTHIGKIENQKLAFAVFSMHVNSNRGIKILQQVLNTLAEYQMLDEDNVLGPRTLEAVAGADPERLLLDFVARCRLFHHSLHIRNRELYPDNVLHSWMQRDDDMLVG